MVAGTPGDSFSFKSGDQWVRNITPFFITPGRCGGDSWKASAPGCSSPSVRCSLSQLAVALIARLGLNEFPVIHHCLRINMSEAWLSKPRSRLAKTLS